MDILIIIDNISLSYSWAKKYNTVKRWLIYWLNDNIIKKNIKTLSIGKTYPDPSLIKLEKHNLKIENVINLFDSIIIKKDDLYNCVNIKNMFDMILKKKFTNSFDHGKKEQHIIAHNHEEDTTYYTNIYVFASITEAKFSKSNIKYLKDSINDNQTNIINFINFSQKKVISIHPKILEKTISFFIIDNYKLYSIISQLLNLKLEQNQTVNDDFTNNTKNPEQSYILEQTNHTHIVNQSEKVHNFDFDAGSVLQKLYEIEFEHYESNRSAKPISQSKIKLNCDYLEILNQVKHLKFDKLTDPYVNFIKHCIKWVSIMSLENIKVNFDIGLPIINTESTCDNVFEIIKFYKLIYPKILLHRAEKSKIAKKMFVIKKMTQLDFSHIKIQTFVNDDSTNYLYSNTTMSNWKQEYENFNPFGILLHYDQSYISYKGIFEHNILSTYPNMIVSSVSNNFISLFDYYQLILGDIDSLAMNKFDIGDWVLIDNLHGNSNIMLPLYINCDHWKLAKIYWKYHMSFVNGAFEFDYVKKMDNIYFLILLKVTNMIRNIKCNKNISRLLFYVLRTNMQICIDNKYSHNNKTDYTKYYQLLLNTCNLEKFRAIFIEYLFRLIQLILTTNIEITEIIEHLDSLFVVFIKNSLLNDQGENYFIIVNKLSTDKKIEEINCLNEKFNLNILCFTDLKQDLIFLCEFVRKIYSIKNFNQLIIFLDKYNGCLPNEHDVINCNSVDTIVLTIATKVNSLIFDKEDIIKKNGLINI
jgi:hypothetical protein